MKKIKDFVVTITEKGSEIKAKELVEEFGKEKALDITETMIDLAKEFDELHDVWFYQEVKNYINKNKIQ